MNTSNRFSSRVLLMGGAVLGIALAASGLLERSSGEQELDEGVAALVNGHPITRDDYQRALAAVAADRREGHLTPADRHRVLERLIDEELLVQRGIELGLTERDRRVRTAISSAVIGLFAARDESSEIEPSEPELRAFYTANAGWFTAPDQLRVEHLFFRVTDDRPDRETRELALRVHELVAGGAPLSDVAGAADDFDVPLPNAHLMVRQLRDLLGPTVARSVAELEVGALTEPVRSGHGYHLARLLSRESGRLPAFAEVRDQVSEEYKRRFDEGELNRFLDERRREVPILVASDLR